VKRPAAGADGAKFGAFKGVFTPSILTILGVIMYLRFGWVVGHGGILGAILVVLLAHVISIATGMSIVSIATNRQVGTGGDYYMISRSLGLPIGGAIGLTLFFALGLSTSLYLIGFAESFLGAFGFEDSLLGRRLVGTVACLLITAVTFKSTSLALRIQYLVLAAIALSLVSLFAGTSDAPIQGGAQLWFAEGSESFEVLFAVFFPAVTGFTAGVAMSGDLKDPRKAIPRGTMAAILFGMAVYLAIPVFLALSVDPEVLRTEKLVWNRVALVPALVVAGVFAATLSSALGSILGAPRYLQALALDGVVPGFLGKGHGPLNEPRIGTLATFVVAEAGILLGELDLVARVITMFFLTGYGFLCIAAGIQTWSGIASFRPDFRTPAWVSFVGAGAALAIMFKIDMLAMIGASLLMVVVWLLLKRRQFKAAPGDTWRGFWMAVAQRALVQLQQRGEDALSWRPNALVFGGDPAERPHLIRLAGWLIGGRGLATYFRLETGEKPADGPASSEAGPELYREVTRNYPEMLARSVTVPSVYAGIRNAARHYGLAGMMPNTVMLGFGSGSEDPEAFAELVRELHDLDHNLLFLSHDDERGFGGKRRIDIWWGGLERNGALMLLLAYFLKSSAGWASAELRVNVIVQEADQREEVGARLAGVLRRSRIKGVPNVLLGGRDGATIGRMMAEVSRDADLTMLGLRPPGSEGGAEFVARVRELTAGLGTALLVRASSAFAGNQVLFEDEAPAPSGTPAPQSTADARTEVEG
jgi:amino acid transporter